MRSRQLPVLITLVALVVVLVVSLISRGIWSTLVLIAFVIVLFALARFVRRLVVARGH